MINEGKKIKNIVFKKIPRMQLEDIHSFGPPIQ